MDNEPEPFTPESLKPKRSIPLKLPARTPIGSPMFKAGASNEGAGYFVIVVGLVVLGYFLFGYDVDIAGAVNLDKLNIRLGGFIIGTGMEIFGAIFIAIARLEYIATLLYESSRPPAP